MTNDQLLKLCHHKLQLHVSTVGISCFNHAVVKDMGRGLYRLGDMFKMYRVLLETTVAQTSVHACASM